VTDGACALTRINSATGQVAKPSWMNDGRTDVGDRGRQRRREAIYIVITVISRSRPHTSTTVRRRGGTGACQLCWYNISLVTGYL